MILNELKKLSEKGYKEFHSKLIPDVIKENILGVRIPHIRKFAKELKNTTEAKQFLSSLPHKYYEENNLHAFLIEEIKDIDNALEETEKFLPFIDNWATCDSFFPPVFRKNPEIMKRKAYEWISSDKTFTVRYGILVLMKMFLGENFKNEYADKISRIRREEYYINMMIAWYFATALSKNYDSVIPFIKSRKLARWTHNKAIQKAVESKVIPKEIKEYLKTLKY